MVYGFEFGLMWADFVMWQRELIWLKCEASLKGGFYVNPEAEMFLIIRIHGYDSLLLLFVVIFVS